MATASSSKSRSSKGKGVSNNTIFDLRAEIAKHEEEFAKNKAAGKSKAVVGGIKRPDKKPTIWAKPNKGVNERASRDIELEAVSKPTLEAARAILERKAAVYEKLSKGKSGGLSDKQYGSLLVDFDSKPVGDWESDSDDIDESLTVPKPPEHDEDPVIEYEDEFGRQRTGRRSEIPRHLLPPDPNDQPPEEDIDPFVIYNPVNHFPVYEPSKERVEAIRTEFAEENNPLNIHYDASSEVRAKGAGFYQFSGDEETRRKQMEELKRAREETEQTRAALGATDLGPGEVEGMDAAATGLKKSRAMEKRKRELEERRKLLDAKRRKKNAPSFEPKEETKSTVLSEPPVSALPTALASDPFALLEAQSTSAKVKASPSLEVKAADDFLAALERDILKGPR
ncbi:hypothetical protein BXZ70DRAFT_202323 [Cristinia sonorae]|uniref:Coiled-coil domain-containing protein 174 n=1 Tax=Cristinia sonorae TaxID=1940300 RepID=A0A8K0XPG0_9AGAR|nr:hypothetical protein BXZ70DRAFT_202323 [Cristinia sonorae]